MKNLLHSANHISKAREWQHKLLWLATGLLLFETLTGLSIWLLPFSVSNQVTVLLHTVAGLVFIIPYAWYQIRHWLIYRQQSMTHVKLNGYFSLAATLVNARQPGQVLMLENLRFHQEEEKNDPEFSKQLAALGEVYVNDAFGSAHRAHASTEGVAKIHKTAAVAGYLMKAELTALGKLLAGAPLPFVVILGGAKVSDKIPLIKILVTRASHLLIDGGMTYTFLKSQSPRPRDRQVAR
jgi:hypothetical protein